MANTNIGNSIVVDTASANVWSGSKYVTAIVIKVQGGAGVVQLKEGGSSGHIIYDEDNATELADGVNKVISFAKQQLIKELHPVTLTNVKLTVFLA